MKIKTQIHIQRPVVIHLLLLLIFLLLVVIHLLLLLVVVHLLLLFLLSKQLNSLLHLLQLLPHLLGQAVPYLWYCKVEDKRDDNDHEETLLSEWQEWRSAFWHLVLEVIPDLLNLLSPESCWTAMATIWHIIFILYSYYKWNEEYQCIIFPWPIFRKTPVNKVPPLFGHCPNSNYTPPSPHSNGHSGALFFRRDFTILPLLPFFLPFFYHFLWISAPNHPGKGLDPPKIKQMSIWTWKILL